MPVFCVVPNARRTVSRSHGHSPVASLVGPEQNRRGGFVVVIRPAATGKFPVLFRRSDTATEARQLQRNYIVGARAGFVIPVPRESVQCTGQF